MSNKSRMNSLSGPNGVQQLGHVRSISRDNGQGWSDTNLGSSTVLPQYQTGMATGGSGSPLRNAKVNDDDQRTVSRGKYGVSADHGDQNTPESNGAGVVFNIGTEQGDALTADSPVPGGAQRPLQNMPEIMARVAVGVGNAWAADQGPGNEFPAGGVMDA